MSTESIRAWEQAARELGVELGPRVRPNVLQWLGYALWRGLPARHDLWVLYDSTCSTWVLRYFARVFVIALIPSVLIAVFLPGGAQLRLTTAFTTGSLAILLTGVWVNEGTEHRLRQAGWPWRLATPLRERRSQLRG